MKEKLENKILEKYPELFKEEETGMTVLWGIECNDGWYDLIDNLCKDIIMYCNSHNCPVPVVTQVKEKFGGLRFYTNGTVWEIDKMIEDAEKESYKICEECGSKQNVEMRKLHGWLTTLCDECCYEREKHIRGYN